MSTDATPVEIHAGTPAGMPVPRSWVRRVFRGLWVGALVLYFVAGLVFLSVRYFVLPNVSSWRTDIADKAAQAIGVPVRIGAISADWDGFRPRLHLRRVELLDGTGGAELGLDRIDATVAWSSLIRLRPFFDRLEIFQPDVRLTRDANGVISVGGIKAGAGSGDDGGLAWLLQQRQVVIRDARLIWEDALRAAPPLELKSVNLRLSRFFGRHRLGLTAASDSGVFGRLDVRADVRFGLSGSLAAMGGQTYVHVDHASIDALAPWLDLPLSLRGHGDAAVWLDWSAGQAQALQTRFSLADARIRFSTARPALELSQAQGAVSVTRQSDGFSISTDQLTLRTTDGVTMLPSDLSLNWRDQSAAQSASLKANMLDLAVLSALGRTLPMTEGQAEMLAALAPKGQFRDLEAGWSMVNGKTASWSLKTRFDELAVQATERWPGIEGVSGQVDGSDQSGRYSINSTDVSLALPRVFLQPLVFDRLKADGSWAQETDRLRFSIGSSSFENADLTGDASGHYFFAPEGAGAIDLQAHLSKANGAAVWRYLPLKVNDHTRDWLKRGIVQGTARDARLRFKGPLDRFPFRQPGEGIFLITAQVTGALIDFAPHWPNIDTVEGALRFEGPRMTITASQGMISGVRLSEVVADVPDLVNGKEVMTIQGKADGQTRDFLKFVADSPVSARINGFTDDIDAEGDGHLDLQLEMPLRHVKDTEVAGAYRFKANRLRLRDGLPWMDNAAGTVAFTGNALTIDQATATVLGGPVSVTASTGSEGEVVFKASGTAQAAAIADLYGVPALGYLSGAAQWQLMAAVGKGLSTLEVSSTLEGLGSSLPDPFNKSVRDVWPSSVTLRFVPGEPIAVDGRVGDRATAKLSIPRESSGGIHGGVGVGAPAREVPDGILLAWKQHQIDLDRWQNMVGDDGAETSPLPIAGVSLEADTLRIRNRMLHDVRLRAVQTSGDWRVEVRSKEAEGTLQWNHQAEGRLVARLSRLTLGKSVSAGVNEDHGKDTESFPALDVEADKFGISDLDLGRLKLSAFNRAGTWYLNALSLDAGKTRLTGSGLWAPGGDGRTQLDFKLETQDVGKLLTRLDYPDAVQRGTATLAGKLSWQGGPAAFDYPSMNGAFELLAESGQFRKLDPGVGRLLGVLSLQSLPRRITLDFRDVFSEGFAFDRISGSIKMTRGVMTTQDMQIRGPAANIVMSGEASIPRETQNLRVRVQPTLSESVAVGAALGGAVINPVAGLVTYIVQKALEDPVEKLFAFEYEVTGTWNDPVVRKLGKTAPARTSTDAPAGPLGPVK